MPKEIETLFGPAGLNPPWLDKEWLQNFKDLREKAEGENKKTVVLPTGWLEAVTRARNRNSAIRRWIVNNKTRRFHFPECPYVEKIKASNSEELSLAMDEVEGAGFKRCNFCVTQ